MKTFIIKETTTYYDVYKVKAVDREDAIRRHRNGISIKQPGEFSEVDTFECHSEDEETNAA